MGGKAFLQELPPESFPRLPTKLYTLIRDLLAAALRSLYAVVQVPAEAPGKKDHGDIDFVVALPLLGEEVATKQVKEALAAIKSIELDGNRTSNYAVDVKVCEDAEELEVIVVLQGYGDLGIMICAIARSYGLYLSRKGLKITSPQPDPPVHLTSSPRAIFDFMGLSMERWTEGFETIEDTFRFAATSHFFNPRRLRVPQMSSFEKSVAGRNTYHDFLVWAQDNPPAVNAPSSDAVEEALVHFGKKAEWDAAARERYERAWLKSNFNGKLVAEWTRLGWRGVKAVMDEVRSSVGGERALVGRQIEDVKCLVLSSKDLLGLSA
ncbi:hypothetical protein F5I97DRAFT_1810706 [Phlebopus sp. FC_14]|nr:hypothetical protein F5I97DRAFT_1810706 [Phlebopus sp. FC_14]